MHSPFSPDMTVVLPFYEGDPMMSNHTARPKLGLFFMYPTPVAVGNFTVRL
jgi:hypothetical protein